MIWLQNHYNLLTSKTFALQRSYVKLLQIEDMIYYLDMSLYIIQTTSKVLQLFSYAILGFALSEATGLFALMMSFLLLYS